MTDNVECLKDRVKELEKELKELNADYVIACKKIQQQNNEILKLKKSINLDFSIKKPH